MKIAILGANGVVGSYLSHTLKHEITAVTRKDLDLLNADQVIQYFNNHSFDVVVNCAANINSNLDVPFSVATDNLTMFSNLHHARNSFGRYIQFCSGAAFDRNRSLDSTPEEELLTSKPTDPYGLSKNISSRIALTTDNFYTVRLFGIFHPTEAKRRLLPKILSGEAITINDRYFDYLYQEDLVEIVNYFATTPDAKYKDVNAVYTDKLLLSEFVYKFCDIHGLDKSHISVSTNSEGRYTGNYTGAATRYQNLDLPILGTEIGMKRYK